MMSSPIRFGEYMGCLYTIESPSKKIYIGITSQKLADRWRAHRAQANRSKEGHLQRAIRKHGAANMVCKPIVIADDYEYLKTLEQKAIKAFNTKSPNGYNMTDGGDGVVGVVITEQGRVRRQAAQQKSFSSPARKAKHKESQQSNELRKLRSENQRKKMMDSEFKKSILEKAAATRLTAEGKQKLLARRTKPKIDDGLNKSQRYRLKDLDSYRTKKNAYAKTESQKEARKIYARVWRLKQKTLESTCGH